MQKGVAFITDIHETGIQTCHQFFNLGNVNVSNGIRCRAWLCLVFYQILVFQQGNRNLVRTNINYYFAGHSC